MRIFGKVFLTTVLKGYPNPDYIGIKLGFCFRFCGKSKRKNSTFYPILKERL